MNNLTTVYLIRHSDKFDQKNRVESYNTTDDKQLKTEKKMLSIKGEKLAEKLSEQEEMQILDKVYCSDYARAMQTAKYLIEKNGLKLNIDERFNERKYGNPDKEKYPNYFTMQYWDKNLKNSAGESQLEVNARMTEAFWEVVNNNRGKKVAIVSHGTSISFLLMNWCKLLDVQNNFLRCLEFNGKQIINRPYYSPEVFKVIVDEENNVIDISNIVFESLIEEKKEI